MATESVGVKAGKGGLPVTIQRGLVDLFLLAVVVQFFLAGLGVFRATSHGHQRLADSTTLDPHRALGTALQVLALIILIVSLVARTMIRESIALLVLMILQSVWVAFDKSAPAVAAVHVLGGITILALVYWMHRVTHGRASPG